MFDLFRSREKSVRILLGALLVLVGLSMLTYLIPNYDTGRTSGSSDTVVADVPGTPVTIYDVQKLVQATMRNKQFPPELLPNYIPTMVDQMVTERAMAYEAARLGFVVTDADVADTIRQIAPSLFPDGKFVGKDAYAAMLAQQQMTIPDFEADLKRQILITRLRDVALEGTIVTPLEIEETFKKKNEQIKVEYVKLNSDKYKSEVQPTADELQRYFTANIAQYQAPEKRNLVILLADQAKLTQTVNPTDAELLQAYNQNKDQYRTPEQAKVRHILLKTQGKPAADEPKIKAQAEDILKQVRSGANFGDLVKKYSEDTGSVANGGEYTVQRNGQMVPEFEKAAFTLKPGESDLIKTAYGYHVIQVMKHEDARLKPFEEVKGEIAAQMKNQEVSAKMQQISDKAQAALQKDPLHPEKVAAEYNMQLVRADGYEPGKPVPEVGTNSDFDQSLSGLKTGEVSQAVALPGNKIALAVVTGVVPARPMTYDEVKDRVRDTVVQGRLTKAVQDHAKELADKAKAMGGDLEKAAKSMGLEVKTSATFTRAGNVEGVGTASYFQNGFLSPDGTILGPILMPDATVVAKVIQHVPADMSKLAEQRTQIRDDIKSQKGRDRNSLFEAGLRDRLIKEGKIKIHQDAVQRIIANYRTTAG
jgi:peptidyl-prolyl cis-trans isomerase D